MTGRSGSFDAMAAGYDDVARSAVGVHYRRRVDAIVDRHLPPEGRVLDVGCGTGIDAARLAGVGHDVVAVDGSANMVERARARLSATDDLRGRAVVHQCDLDHLDTNPVTAPGADEYGGPFALVLANFGAINCSRDLPRFGRWLASVLEGDGVAVLVTMAPICPPELLQGLVTGNRGLLARRRSGPSGPSGGRNDDAHDPHAAVAVRYFSARRLVAELGPGFVLEDARAIGVVVPTFEQRRLAEGRPRLLRSLGFVDRMVGSPAVGLATGDHHVAVIRPDVDR